MIEVTVAIFGPSFDYPTGLWTGPSFDDQGRDVSYADRLKLRLEVDDADTLGSVIDRTAEHFSVSFKPAPPGTPLSEVLMGVAFYMPEDESGFYRMHPWRDSIRLLNDAGEPSWAVRWADVSRCHTESACSATAASRSSDEGSR